MQNMFKTTTKKKNVIFQHCSLITWILCTAGYNGLFPDGQNYDEESNAHSTQKSHTNVPVSSKNVVDGALYKFGLIHAYLGASNTVGYT